ncbi:MAG: hypothetical protein WBB77_07770, partial [Candidatus Nanopelagicales bacterium]
LLSGDAWHSGDTKAIGMYLAGKLRSRSADGRPQSDSSFLLLLNASDEQAAFTLPNVPYGRLYRRILDTKSAIPRLAKEEKSAGTTVEVAGYGAMLLEVTAH